MSEVWESNRVLVPGGAGFPGKVVTRKLEERGYRENREVAERATR